MVPVTRLADSLAPTLTAAPLALPTVSTWGSGWGGAGDNRRRQD